MKISITHKEFIEGYKSNKLKVLINKNKAGDFVLSPLADKHNKPAHLFWTWLAIILVVPTPIVLFFIKWYFSIISFVVGLIVLSASRKSATGFILQNMIESQDFWCYVLIHRGANISDDEGNEYSPKI